MMQVQDTTTGAADNGQAAGRAEARARVRALLWDRLDQAGMQRPRGQSVEDHAAMRARLCDRLAYLTADNLSTLAELMIDNATGKARPRAQMWCETAIRSYAKALQVPPAMEFDIVRSWLASVEGPPAIDGGFEVELFRFLRRRGLPPLADDLFKIRRAADDAARRIALVRERIGREAADAEDRAWLEAYQRDRQTVAAIVAYGQRKRAGAGA